MGYTNGCHIPHTLRRNDIFYTYFRPGNRQFLLTKYRRPGE